jgi:hypothetical protein
MGKSSLLSHLTRQEVSSKEEGYRYSTPQAQSNHIASVQTSRKVATLLWPDSGALHEFPRAFTTVVGRVRKTAQISDREWDFCKNLKSL